MLVQVQCPLSDICFGGAANVVLTLISCFNSRVVTMVAWFTVVVEATV